VETERIVADTTVLFLILINRDKESADIREKELKETERRRKMTDAEVTAENERINPSKEKSNIKFLQKYYHKVKHSYLIYLLGSLLRR
jgi:single-stranded DNA-specific DHH superfamily exonuclease